MHKQVIEFWFDEIEPIMWFKKDDDFDRLLHSRFGEIWRAAAAGSWRIGATPSKGAWRR